MIEGTVFLDTNILVYAHDTSAGKKHEIASKILLDLWDSGQGVISTQVLQEFFLSVTRKIPKPMQVEIARDIVEDLLKWNVVINDGDSILAAIDIHNRYRYSFWDALIIQAAIQGGADQILSEDLSHGHSVYGVRIINPFL